MIHRLPSDHAQADWLIPDPGASGAISTIKSGVCNLVSAAAETRTLGIPTYVGQMIVLCLDTDGGNCVVTVAAAINQTGNNTITFADAGEAIMLIGCKVAGVLRWRAFTVQPESEAPALSTV